MGGTVKDEKITEPEPPQGQPEAEGGSEGAMGTAQEDAELAEIEAALASVQPGSEAQGADEGMKDAISATETLEPAGYTGLPKDAVPLPPAESTTGALPFSPEAYQDPGPTGSLKSKESPLQKDALPAEPELVRFFIKDERMDKLWKRADAAKEKLDTDVHTIELGRMLLDQIKYARNYLLAGRDYYEEAERHINEVEFLLKQNLQARKWSASYGLPLFFYEVVWGIAFILLFLSLHTPVFAGFNADVRGMLATMICGGLGGVTGAWFALIKHTAQDQDFDKQHTMWYLNSPLMGAGLGAFVYWIMRGGLIAITNADTAVEAPWVIYILGWLAGYQHNVFTSLVKRVIKIFDTDSGSENTSAGAATEAFSSLPAPTAPDAEEGPSKKG